MAFADQLFPRVRVVHRLVVCLTLLLGHVAALAQTPDLIGEWGPVLNWGYQGKHMALLPTDKVLVFRTGDSARVWDPVANVFTQTPFLFGDLHCAAQVSLADGRVLVIGGQNGPPHVGIKVTALFDPFTSTWTQGTLMTYERWYPTATTLADGRVLATSGDDAIATRVPIPEVYDPVANTWTQLTGANRDQGLYPFMYVLPNGKIYEAGTRADTWLLDLSGTGSWTPGPTNGFGSSGYAESGAMYAPGKIIRSGGTDPAIDRAAIIDMTAAAPQWKEVNPMAFPRRRHNMVILADGSVMVVGGTRQADSETSAVLEAEIWNPQTEQWTTVAAASQARAYHSTTLLLPDGRVVWAGGEMSGRLNAQVYSPPYLFQGPRPAILSSPQQAPYGSSFAVGMSDTATIASVALFRPAAVTHAFDHNQRLVPLAFTQSFSDLAVTAPANGNIAPPGVYMLIVKDTNGVPSPAKWVRVDTSANLQSGTITGQVTDNSTGAGISGASVSYSEGSTTTDGNGNYTLVVVMAGERLVTASATGYAAVSQTATVPAGGTATLNFALTAPGTITGEVTDSATGSAIAGATITYSGGTTSTAANGSYSITGIASGSQTITASATGYDSAQQTVTVPPNGTATANFALNPTATFITGEVRDSMSLSVIVGATVSYSGGSTTTDALGRYTLNNTPPGTYDVVASASGHTSVTHQVVVSAGQYAVSDFALPPTSGTGVTHVETKTGGSSSSATVTTAATLTAVSGDLYLAAVATRPNRGVNGLAGLGLSWTRVKTQCSGRNQTGLQVWRAQGTPTSSGPVSATLASAATNAVIAVSHYSGVAAANPIGNVVSGNTKGADGLALCSGGVDNNAYAFNLTTTANGAWVYGAAAMRNRLHSPGAGYTERAEVAQGTAGNIASVATEDQSVATAAPVTVNGSFSGSVDWAVIGLEVKPQ